MRTADVVRHRTPMNPWLRKVVFAGVGLSVMLLGYVILYVAIEVLHWHHSVAYVTQAVVSIELNFVLNYLLTWRDRREGSVWGAFGRFHLSRVVTFTGNQILFNTLIAAAVPYLVANTICIIGTTIVNYVVGDRFTFRKSRPQPPRQRQAPKGKSGRRIELAEYPRFSVVIPVKNNADSIRSTVEALLNQDYPVRPEIIVVGDKDDTSWSVLQGLKGNLILVEAQIASPGRDSNMKRDIGLSIARPESRILAVIDGDVVVDPDWMRKVAYRLQDGEIHAVAGPVSGIGEGFWTDYIDRNPAASKTPRIKGRFMLDGSTLGKRKPPVTANFALTRRLYDSVGGPNVAFTNSYEDYEWFSRIIQAGYGIMCDDELDSVRYHREGLRPLMREYRRSGKGCADHIYTHFRKCRFAMKRLRDLVVFYTLLAAGLVMLAVLPLPTLATGVFGAVALSLYSWLKVRRAAALVYPFISLLLGWMFVIGLTGRLLVRPRLVQPTLHIVDLKSLTQATGEYPTIGR